MKWNPFTVSTTARNDWCKLPACTLIWVHISKEFISYGAAYLCLSGMFLLIPASFTILSLWSKSDCLQSQWLKNAWYILKIKQVKTKCILNYLYRDMNIEHRHQSMACENVVIVWMWRGDHGWSVHVLATLLKLVKAVFSRNINYGHCVFMVIMTSLLIS